jgi:hypothetical protein
VDLPPLVVIAWTCLGLMAKGKIAASCANLVSTFYCD